MPSQPSHAERARTLVHAQSSGALSTVALDPSGYPFGSHVRYAMHEKAPILLLSRLAEHTKNLTADPRASLLVVDARAAEDPLALGRVTLIGRISPSAARAEATAAFVAAIPSAAAYASFADFSPFVLEVEEVRYVGGFGRMSWVDRAAWTAAEPDPLVAANADICAHMNEDHADACVMYARHFGKLADASTAVMSSVDRYGFDLQVGERTLRIAFAREVTTPTDVRKVLVAMLREARGA